MATDARISRCNAQRGCPCGCRRRRVLQSKSVYFPGGAYNTWENLIISRREILHLYLQREYFMGFCFAAAAASVEDGRRWRWQTGCVRNMGTFYPRICILFCNTHLCITRRKMTWRDFKIYIVNILYRKQWFSNWIPRRQGRMGKEGGGLGGRGGTNGRPSGRINLFFIPT